MHDGGTKLQSCLFYGIRFFVGDEALAARSEMDCLQFA